MWLDRALEGEDPFIRYAKVFFAFDGLRNDPRFDAFIEKAGLSKIEIPQASTSP